MIVNINKIVLNFITLCSEFHSHTYIVCVTSYFFYYIAMIFFKLAYQKKELRFLQN